MLEITGTFGACGHHISLFIEIRKAGFPGHIRYLQIVPLAINLLQPLISTFYEINAIEHFVFHRGGSEAFI
jgi:hypothetical protein